MRAVFVIVAEHVSVEGGGGKARWLSFMRLCVCQQQESQRRCEKEEERVNLNIYIYICIYAYAATVMVMLGLNRLTLARLYKMNRSYKKKKKEF